jgi:predicted Rdx family selenoprotein
VAPAGCVGGPRLRSALVPLTAIIVHVMRPGRRADELLAAVAKNLGRGTQIPDERGHVRILLEESEGAAWQRIHDALDAAGDDWHEHLHVNPRPG